MIVDGHHHFWDPRRAVYDWMTDEIAPIRRPFGPDDLEPILQEEGVAGTVAVQARTELDETRELLEIASEHPFVVGVVGWVDLTDPDVSAVLRDVAHPRLVGIRHTVHDEADASWLLREDVQRGLAAVAEAGLVYDLLVRTRELPAAYETVMRFPELSFVIDHLAKPPLAKGDTHAWSAALAPFSELPNVVCKLSGLVTEADWNTWTPDELVPYLRRVLDWFGADRCLFGSDWPVCLLAASYADVLALGRSALRADEEDAVLATTATRVYGLRLDVSRG